MIKTTVELIRLESNKDYGTLGIIRMGGEVFCCTLEPPDNENRNFISCIPPGSYICQRYYSNKYGWTYQVMDVYGRTYILIHPGNSLRNTLGCILVGETFGKLANADRAVLNSGKTFKAFMNKMNDMPEFVLIIKEYF